MKSEKQSEARKIAAIKKQGRESLLDYYPDIVTAIAKQALQGSVPHAKLVFELLDIAPRKSKDDDEETSDHPSLAEYLIEQLQLAPPPDDASQAETI